MTETSAFEVIALDLDGTLLRKGGKVRERTLAADRITDTSDEDGIAVVLEELLARDFAIQEE